MAEMLNENFNLLRQLFSDCLAAKSNPTNTKIDLDEKLKLGSLLFVLIKKINRMVKYRVRAGREELQSQKSLVDNNRLHLQNLLYEVNYLKREIRHCYQFKSQDEDIDICEPDSGEVNELESSHKQRIARLERELTLRKQLSDDCAKLLNAKTKVFHEIITKMENLATFAPSLRTLLKATKPLQEALQLPLEQIWKLDYKVHLLPPSLYLAYVNLRLIEMEDIHFKINVMGCEDEVKNYEAERKQTHITSLEKDQFFQPHPLYLQMKIQDPDFMNDSIVVNFYNFSLLDLVTGYCDIGFNESNIAIAETNLLQDFLKYICENDIGEIMPYAEINLKIEKQNLTTEEFYDYLGLHNFGKPYRWVQEVCGTSSLNTPKTTNSQNQKIKEFAADVVKRIKLYWNSRLCLSTQIKAFMNKNLDNYMDGKAANCKPNCSLVQWSALNWEEYEANTTTMRYIEEELVDASFSFYRAVVVFSSAKMECLISISNKYPHNAPLWIITVHWNGHHNALNNSSIKFMEHWTNSLCDSKNTPDLLAAQLLRTMYSFDIFLETEGPLYQPLEYNKEKSFIKSFSKRTRVRPYKRITSGANNYFKQ
ncbi:THO complex subunit 5 [Glossina fuscipes]|uniref:THO complex subunit 5 n=1 Tax=Glossina fuscipes TaxID=7396 RepID=A0A9C6DXS4_9MUSC|nr:THO complex subunit 5 [Glossina fuscipes]KAI9577764.1 hypothetical protein GQX74_010951 [Glossina fuscipes]